MVTWVQALTKTRQAVFGRLKRIFTSNKPLAETLEELEECLLRADVSMKVVQELMATMRKAYGHLETSHRAALGKLLEQILPEPSFAWRRDLKPQTILVVGVNGSGKTTTCAKLAHLARKAGVRPLLGAADTFRAAGSDQLRIWADRLGCEVVTGATGADAAAVAYDAMEAGIARGSETLIIDTAGRMHTRQPLMQELQKVQRAMAKRRPGAPDETWIVLDASLGQNAVHQARQFHDAVPLTGVIVAKLDGSAKAGFVFSLVRELQLPIVFAGLGEGPDDLVPFDRHAFVSALLGGEDAGHA